MFPDSKLLKLQSFHWSEMQLNHRISVSQMSKWRLRKCICGRIKNQKSFTDTGQLSFGGYREVLYTYMLKI